MVKKAASAQGIARMGFTIHFLSGENVVVLMPCARPSSDTFDQLIEAEQKLGSDGFTSQATTDRLAALDKEGRVLWGWSPWRAKNKALTWDQWDAFCKRWLGEPIVLPNRTAEFNATSFEVLFAEIEALQTAGRVKVVSPWPFGYKRADKEAKSGTRKRRKGNAPVDDDQ